MANTFMCGIEEQLEIQNKMPAFYKRYVDDTLSKMPDATAASEFLLTLNEIHPSVSFTIACSRRSESGARAKNKARKRAAKNEGRLGKRTRERL